MQKAIEEAKKFVCTTKDRIVKDTKEFIQNVDWKKVAIGVAATAAITLAVVATGGAAAPVLIGAAVGAGISTGTTVVSGVIQGKSPAEIAQDASGAFMWGAIGGAVGGGTTSLLESVGSSTAGNYVRQNLIEGGMDTAVDLAQSASNGGLTPQGVVTSVVTNMVGAFINAPDTPSTTRNQLVDGVTDNKAVKNAVTDSVTDNKAVKNAVGDSVSKEKTYQTYTKTNPTTGEVYSGRTSGYGSPAENVRNRDRNHHMKDKGFGPAELDRSSNSYEAIRGREQDLIDYYGGAKSTGGTSGNAINGISDKNPNKDLYISSSRDEFGVLK